MEIKIKDQISPAHAAQNILEQMIDEVGEEKAVEIIKVLVTKSNLN